MTLPAVAPTEPVTAAGRTILAKLSRTPYIALADPRLAVRAIETEARAGAGHRVADWREFEPEHDCFLMNCARLGDDVIRLQKDVVEAAETMRQRIRHEFRDLPLIVAVIDGMEP